MSNDAAVVALLRRARYEILPTPSIEDVVRASVPTEIPITITASPTRSLEVTVSLAERLAATGYIVIPHLAARMIRGRAELAEIVARLEAVGITGIFVPGGDATPGADNYDSAYALLCDLATMPHPFTQIGVAGYPESHPSIVDDVLVQAMWDKRQHATHIVSNMTFDADLVNTWLRRVRRRGVTQPVLIGLPGPVERTKLLSMATTIGVGESMRFLTKQKGVFARIAAPGYSPEKFLRRLAHPASDPAMRLDGLHIFTFNQVAETHAWRQDLLDRFA